VKARRRRRRRSNAEGKGAVGNRLNVVATTTAEKCTDISTLNVKLTLKMFLQASPFAKGVAHVVADLTLCGMWCRGAARVIV
jgi:hypothetical protein